MNNSRLSSFNQRSMHDSFRGFGKSINLHVDWLLLTAIVLLFCLGLLILYSAKLDYSLIKKQGLRLAIAMTLMFIIAQIPPRYFRSWAPWLYAVSFIMLLMVLFTGEISKGGQRWLNLGIIRFQPSELMKLAVPLMVAYSLEAQILPPKIRFLILPTLYVVAPVILVALQPDLGTAILFASSGFLVIFFAGVSWRLMLSVMCAGIAASPFLWMFLHDYQRDRILTVFNPEKDPLGKGYQIIQSKIAIGAGGMYGKGWLQGTQSHLEFIPERTTDFIFAIFGEEFGFVGILLLLALYTLIIVRCLFIGIQAQDTFCRLLAGSLIMTFFVYVFVNISMVNGILPVVGIPLPLISYGGTSLVTIMISFGILMSIKTHKILVRK